MPRSFESWDNCFSWGVGGVCVGCTARTKDEMSFSKRDSEKSRFIFQGCLITKKWQKHNKFRYETITERKAERWGFPFWIACRRAWLHKANNCTTATATRTKRTTITTTDYFDSDHRREEPIGLLSEFLSFGTLPRLDTETVQLQNNSARARHKWQQQQQQ